MLTNFLSEGYYEVIVAFYNSSLSEGEGALSEEDINMAKIFVTFLKLFYDLTCCLSAVYKPTSHLAIHSLCAIAQHFKTNMDYVIFQDCISSMRDKFLKYWGKGKIPYLYGYACILDPRIQMDGFKMFLNFLQDMFIGEDYITHHHNRIVEGFYDLFRVYQERVAPPSEPSPPRNARQEEEYMFLSVHRHFRGVDGSPQSSPRGRGGRGSPQPSRPIYDEISRYTTHLHVEYSNTKLDLLDWWRQHEGMLPILASMARDILTIHVSTVSSESAFSSSGRIIDDRRCSLSPEMIEALTVGKDWILHSRRAQETFREIEIIDDFDTRFSNINLTNP